MDRSVAQALSSLLPALGGPLPPELVELAVSILAQSRSKASSLKADEEIARSYACANIACERLKHTLSLPKIQPRPPCPPKVYHKLYQYLDGALSAGARRTPRSVKTSVPAQTSSPAKPRTPSKAAHLRPDTPKRKTPRRNNTTASEVSVWVMPVIRRLCKELETPAAPHHVFAGVSSILMSTHTEQEESPNPVNISALIVIVYSLVTTRLSGFKRQPAEYRRENDRALEILNESAGNDPERRDVEAADLEECMQQVKSQQWTQMDWFENIPIGGGLGLDQNIEDVVARASHSDEIEEEDRLPLMNSMLDRDGSSELTYLQAGLGTMMQDRVDYLSDVRRHDFQEWKKSILAEIEQLEKTDGMEVGVG